MARDAMPPMVVSSNRYFDIEPYSNRLRESNPIKWGSIFPWEFPQNAEKAQEEAFLRKFFTPQEIHVQGGAGSKDEPGAGYRFLKQVWYTQAIFNWEQRVPAFIDWWLKNAEAAVYIHDPSMRKFILAPEATLTTFFQTADIQTYGEKFLSQVYPMIQQAARAKIDEQKNDTAKKDASNDQITRTVAQVAKPMHASEPSTAAFEAESDMPGLTKTFSQPADDKHKMLSPVEARRPAPHSTIPQPAHPRVISSDEPSRTELSTFNRKRGNAGRRFSNRGGLHQSNTPPHLQMPDTTGVPAYRSVSGMSMSPYQGHPTFNQQPGFAPVMSHGPPVGQPPAHFDPSYYFPPPHPVQHPANFNSPFNGPPPQVYWATNPLAVRENGPDPHSNSDGGRGKVPAFRGGYEHHSHEFRGDHRNRAFMGDRGRGRGRGRGRNSFGSQGQAPAYGPNRTTHEFKLIDPGFDFATRVRRPSVVSVEKNWRSGSERPQDLLSPGRPENIAPPRFAGKYVPAHDSAAHGFAPAFQRLNQASNPSHAPEQAQTESGPIDDPRYHCTQHAIGVLCTYANKLTVWNIPIAVNEHEIIDFFRQFGPVQSFYPMNARPSHCTNPFRPPRDDYMAFICFETVDAARRCLMNHPETWLADNRPFRVEVPKEYWDSTHTKYWMHKNPVIPGVVPSHQQFSTTHAGAKDAVATHRSQESSSTIRGPPAATTEPPSGSEERTPTASGTSTPKKKSKPNNKGKGRKGKGNDGDENSLVAPKPPKSKLELNTKEIMPAPRRTPFTNDSTPTAEIDKLRSASEVTERQTASEPSDTPVDRVVAKLPIPGGKGEKTQTSTASAAHVVLGASPKEPRKDSGLQTAAEPPSTVSEPASGKVASDANGPGQLFREGEAKKATSPETFVTDSGGVQKETDTLTADVTATPVKAEEEHVDDSFHTATGSPSTPKDHVQIDGHQAATNEEIAALSTQGTLDDGSAETRVETKTSEAKETSASIDDKSASKTASLSVDTQPPSKSQQRKLTAGKRSASSGGSLNPPPEFVTAPNTPYIEQESDKQAASEDAGARQSKKVEKKKGPAETESLSLFGKKQEKKPKQPKRGTLKGKPKNMPDAADATSDASPYPSKPPSETGDAPLAERKTGKKSDNRGQSEKQVSGSVKQSSNPTGKGNQQSISDGAATPDDPPATDELPKNRGSIFNNIGRYFTGQTSQNNPKEKQGNSSQSTKSSLTDVKAPANNPEQGHLARKQGNDTKPQSSVCGVVKSIEAGASNVSDADSVKGNSSRSIAGFTGSNREAGNTGLGIMNVDGTDEKSGSTSKKKRKPKKKKDKTKQTAGGLDELTPEVTPEATPEPEVASTSQQQPFRPGTDDSNFNFRIDTPGFPRSNRSDSPPNMFGVATPSNGTSSPTVSKQPRKLPSALGKGIVEEKVPKWKNRKRLHRGAGGTEESVNSSDEENKNYELESVNSNGNTGPLQIQVVDTSSAAGTDNTPRSIVLVPGSRVVLLFPSQNGSNDDERAGDAKSNRIEDVTDDIVEVNEVLQDEEKEGAEGKGVDGSGGDGAENTTVKESKKKMQLLLEQESSRKYGRKDVSAVEVEPERMTGEDKAKVEAARKLHPGRPIVFAQLIDESSEDA